MVVFTLLETELLLILLVVVLVVEVEDSVEERLVAVG